MSNKLRYLFWDIETSHDIIAKFGLYPEYTPHKNILQDWFIVCAAWKWSDSKKVESISLLDGKDIDEYGIMPGAGHDLFDDRIIVSKLAELTKEADVLVHHNGDKFDLKKLRTRMIKHRLEPFLPKPITIDTLKEAKRLFAFTSNRLDYLGTYFEVGSKISAPPDLWLNVLKGDITAISKMTNPYCTGDVRLLERVFKVMSPYIKHPNVNSLGFDRPVCPNINCQSTNVHKIKTRPTAAGILKQQWQCQKCGSYTTTRASMGQKTITKSE